MVVINEYSVSYIRMLSKPGPAAASRPDCAADRQKGSTPLWVDHAPCKCISNVGTVPCPDAGFHAACLQGVPASNKWQNGETMSQSSCSVPAHASLISDTRDAALYESDKLYEFIRNVVAWLLQISCGKPFRLLSIDIAKPEAELGTSSMSEDPQNCRSTSWAALRTLHSVECRLQA